MRIHFGIMALALLVCALGTGCAGRGGGEPSVPSSLKAEYRPADVKRLALVPPKEFTPEDEAVVRIEDPLTGTLVRTLRGHAGIELLPGNAAKPRDLVAAVRGWIRRSRGAAFPQEAFETLTRETPADAYLVLWVDRSSHPWVVNEALEKVPAERFQLDLTAVLLSPAGKVYWIVRHQADERFVKGQLGNTVRAAVDGAMAKLEEALTRGVVSVGARGAGGSL